MASFTDTVKIVIDVVTNQASSGLNDIKAKTAEAEGGFGKLKAGASGAMSSIGVGASTLAIGAGAAVGGFVAKAIGDFESLALSAENFSKVAGTTVQDASRWIEVSNDLSVPVDAVQAAMARLNREAAQGKLAQFGIDATNANDRLIQSVQYLSGITDETQRSQAAFQLFGKSAAALAPLIASAGELKQRMAEVEGAKVISDENVKDARQFRDDMDRVTDAVDNLVLSAGKIALPVVDMLAQIAGPLAEIIGKLSDARAATQEQSSSGGNWWDPALEFMTATGPEAIDFFLNKTDELTGGTGKRFGDVGDSILKVGDTIDVAGKKFVELSTMTKDVTGMTDEQIKSLVNQDAALHASTSSADESTQSQQAMAQASADATKALADESKALAAQADAFSASANSQVAADQASRDASQAFEDLDGDLKKIADSNASASTKTRETQKAYEEAAGAAVKMADANVKLDGDQAKAAGTTRSHTQALDVWNASILTAAANADGPLHEAIINHIAAVNGIPPEKVTEILASTPNLDEQKKLIDEASAARKLTITADADTSPATAAVNAFLQATENKTAYIDVVGRLSTQGQALAGGGPAGGLSLVGEQGPELVVLPNGSYVYTASQTRGMIKAYADGGGVGTGNRDDLLQELNNVLKELAVAQADRAGATDPAVTGLMDTKIAMLTDQVAALRAQLHASGVWTPPTALPPWSGPPAALNQYAGWAGVHTGGVPFVAAPAGGSQYNSSYYQDYGGFKADAAAKAAADAAAKAARIAALPSYYDTPVHIENLTINMPMGANGDDIVQALKRYQRRNGAVPITTLS